MSDLFVFRCQICSIGKHIFYACGEYKILHRHFFDGNTLQNSFFNIVLSKKISNDQELIQSDPISWPQTKREITKYINWRQFTKGTRGKQNEQLFPK